MMLCQTFAAVVFSCCLWVFLQSMLHLTSEKHNLLGWSGDWHGDWRIPSFFPLRNSWAPFEVCLEQGLKWDLAGGGTLRLGVVVQHGERNWIEILRITTRFMSSSWFFFCVCVCVETVVSWPVLLQHLLLFVANWIWLDIYLGDSQADYQTLDTIKLV